MDDQVSNAELARRLQDLTDMLREDIAEIRQAHASFVVKEVYEARHERVRAEVSDLGKRMDQEAEQRRTLSRWVVGSVVLPIIFFVYQIVANAQGTGAG